MILLEREIPVSMLTLACTAVRNVLHSPVFGLM